MRIQPHWMKMKALNKETLICECYWLIVDTGVPFKVGARPPAEAGEFSRDSC